MFKKLSGFRKKQSANNHEASQGGSDLHHWGSDSSTTTPSGHSTARLNLNEQSFASNSTQSVPTNSDDLSDLSEGGPVGLKVIHRPPGHRTADLVFVHGLGGNSRKTWMKHHNPESFWPLKFLPQEPHLDAVRILTFGYNATYKSGSGRTNISLIDFSKQLLSGLKYASDDYASVSEDLCMGERPIIFVAHSMGGLVVKEAYLRGQTDPVYQDITNSVHSMLFLSTPHRGSNLAATLNKVLQLSFKTAPRKYIDELVAGSPSLQKLNEDFRHVAPKLEIFSFYETRPTAIYGRPVMVVEAESSVLGYPGEISIPLDADHLNICKYETRSDSSYIEVRNILKHLVSKICKSGKLKSDRVDRINNFTWAPEPAERDFSFFRDRWTKGTCTWILDHPSFLGWVNDPSPRSRILWVHGNAATGKSVLASFVINHLVEKHGQCQYFFFRFDDQAKRSVGALLRSLAHQLAQVNREYADILHQLAADAPDPKTASARIIWQYFFKQSLFELNLNAPLYWIVDGLDEADDSDAFLKLLFELSQATSSIRFIIFSRHTRSISFNVQKLRSINHWLVDTLQLEGDQRDFRCHIDDELDVAGESSYKEHVVSQILNRSEGNFLWVHLAIQKINKCYTKSDLEAALQDLPSGMENLYDRMATTVQTQPSDRYRRIGYDILGWLCCSERQIALEELSDALGELDLIEMPRAIGDLCGGFVVVDANGQIALIHETAREYLMEQKSGTDKLTIDRKSTHDRICQRSLKCFADPMLRGHINRDMPPAFLKYASGSWFSHFAQGNSTSLKIFVEVVKFLTGPQVLVWIQVVAKEKQLGSLVAASRSLTAVTSRLRNMGLEESSEHHEAAHTLSRWAVDFVKIVGKFGSSLTQRPDAIYKLIPPFCPESSIIFELFGKKDRRTVQLSGFIKTQWDDRLACFSLEEGLIAASVHAVGGHILILANNRKSSHIYAYSSTTFELKIHMTPPERVHEIEVDARRIVSYGYQTTTIWDLKTGELVKSVPNPQKKSRSHGLSFLGDRIILYCEDQHIYRLNLTERESIWELDVRIYEQAVSDAILTAPICSSLSPDGAMIAFGYRRHPATVWDLKSLEQINHCSITAQRHSDKTIQDNTYGEVIQLSWHPFNMEIIGLHREGLLFKWNPYDEEPSHKVQTGAQILNYSHDGSLIVTGDSYGTIKVFGTADLSLLYQLSSQDPVVDILFSSDSKRLYDIRREYGNVWEPTTLVRLADASDSPDGTSDSLGKTESVAKVSIHADQYFFQATKATVIAAQAKGSLYCYGTESDVVILSEVGFGTICEVERLARYMCIKQVAWSHDGSLIAIGALSGRLSIKKIFKDDAEGSWQAKHEFGIIIPTKYGQIEQVFFMLGDDQLFVATSTALFVVSMSSHEISEYILPLDTPRRKWICHPKDHESVLGFGTDDVCIYANRNQQSIGRSQKYDPPRISTPTMLLSPINAAQSQTRRDSKSTRGESLGRLLTDETCTSFVLQISTQSQSGPSQSEYLIFSSVDIRAEKTRDDSDAVVDLPYTIIPGDVACRIREPLALLSRRRLLFLDHERWICTWSLDSIGARHPQGGRGSGPDIMGVEQHYFLPGDWAMAEEVRRCTAMLDGTFLCPKHGDVAAVKFSKLKG